jgi:hypothetical protein
MAPDYITEAGPSVRAFETKLAALERKYQIKASGVGTQKERGRIRSEWLDARLKGEGDVCISKMAPKGGPSFNTVKKYRAGITTSQTKSVRAGLAKAFKCLFSEVPE